MPVHSAGVYCCMWMVIVQTSTNPICVLFSARQKFPLHISQDGNNTAVTDLARSTDPAQLNMSHLDLSLIPSVVHMQHIEADTFPTRKKTEPIAYYRIASHYKFVMRQIFDCWQYPKLIVLEVHDYAPCGDRMHCCTAHSHFDPGLKCKNV